MICQGCEHIELESIHLACLVPQRSLGIILTPTFDDAHEDAVGPSA
jgi:hypothetical protein